jgi:hypothetical protein
VIKFQFKPSTFFGGLCKINCAISIDIKVIPLNKVARRGAHNG